MKKICLVLISVILVLSLAYGIIYLSNLEQNKLVIKQNVEEDLNEEALPKVGSIENLKKMLKDAQTNMNKYYVVEDLMADGAIAESSSALNDGVKSESHSETNIQENGVDEGDIVKTDGKNIYQLTNSELIITKAYPVEEMKILERLAFNDGYTSKVSFYPIELYIDDDYITVVAQMYGKNYWYYDTVEEDIDELEYKNLVLVAVYDINSFELVRKIEIEGNYVSSRKIGSSVYVVTNKYIYYKNNIKDNEIMPLYKDTLVSNDYTCIDVDKMCYFPDFTDTSCLLISSFKLDNNESVQIKSYLGAGNEIYASTEYLYVTQPYYEKENALIEVKDRLLNTSSTREVKTNIYKFLIEDGKTEYKGMGTVPGTLLNQFSMSEDKGYFRIATTIGDTYDGSAKNNLYVLNNKMETVGKLENLAEGERIYSTRFMGDKCYIVTYQYVDPLFVIDLSDNENPKVLGELKIPGYSDYLHPYKDNYLIGFGKDTIVKKIKKWDGTTSETAYEVGLKMALFDISDFENPKELYSVKIGDRGSYSELSYNHKSLLFDEAKNIIAFPAIITESTGTTSKGIPNYGETVFAGALVYGLDLNGDGFYLKGKITHENASEYSNVNRILYIDDVLYTTSNSMIKANNINTFEELNKIEF